MTNVITSFVQLKAVLLSLMISNASQVAAKLNLPETLPIARTNLVVAFVSPPVVIPYMGLGGAIDTPTWMYGYPKEGKLAYIIRKKPNFWIMNDVEEYSKFEVSADQIDTNRAFQIATQWLSGLSVDMKRLSTECTLKIRNKILGGRMIIPEYHVSWWKANKLVASVIFMEPGRQLWQIRVEDPSLLLRTSITNGLVFDLPEVHVGPQERRPRSTPKQEPVR